MSESKEEDERIEPVDEASRQLSLITDLFHQINHVLPEQQNLLTFRPELPAAEAVKLLIEHGYSQAPVAVPGFILGVFSFRSFAKRSALYSLSEAQKQKRAPCDFTVEECLETFNYARVTDEMSQVFDSMDRDNGVLIGSPNLLQGILTPMDFLKYLHRLASPFVAISEIELTLRALIKQAVTPEILTKCSERALSKLHDDGKIPDSLEKMTFDNYRSIISNGENWPLFERFLGANRTRISAKLSEIAELRNDVFHFKREITQDDHEKLKDHREWLLVQAKKADANVTKGGIK